MWSSLGGLLGRPRYGVQKPGMSEATESASEPLPPPASKRRRALRMRRGQGPLPRDVGGLRPLGSPAPRRLKRPGRGTPADHAPSGPERDRAGPNASECHRAEPSGGSRLVQLRPRRSAVRGSGAAAAAASAGSAWAVQLPVRREAAPRRGESSSAPGAASAAAAR